MSFESAQTNFLGQEGWNDLAPDALNLTAQQQKVLRGKPRPRRVITPYTTSPVPPPPASSTTPAGPPLKSPPPKAASMLSPPAATTSTQTDSSEPWQEEFVTLTAEVSSETVLDTFRDFAARPSQLPESEVKAQTRKVEMLIPLLPQIHLQFINNVLTSSADKATTRKQLVDYSLQNKNVSGFTVPIRRLLDQQI